MSSSLFSTRLYRAAWCAFLVAGCKPSSLVDVQAPATVVDPSTVATATGATQLYYLGVSRLATTIGGTSESTIYGNWLALTGQFTDELMNARGDASNIDERNGSSVITIQNGGDGYQFPNNVRVEEQQARQALALYAPAAPKAWQGQLYALEGFAVVFLGEYVCSGVPLTAVPLVGSPQPTRGFTTQEVYEHAVALFDSAIVVGADTPRFVNLARVGKGRALLNLGRFADAAAAVHDVPTDFVYTMSYGVSLRVTSNMIGNNPRMMQTVDGEGLNGLNWSTDPRTAIVTTPTLSGGMKYSAKYSQTAIGTLDPTIAAPAAPVRLADGLEARLIEAEAALAAGDANWLTMVNTLRATCIGTTPCAPVPGLTTASLLPLTDPGTANTRLDLLMKERAMWLFLTGHRQGDLRRAAHVYQRDPNTLYPTGTYVNSGFPPLIPTSPDNGKVYGTDLVYPITVDERTGNPLYGGCYDLDP